MLTQLESHVTSHSWCAVEKVFLLISSGRMWARAWERLPGTFGHARASQHARGPGFCGCSSSFVEFVVFEKTGSLSYGT